MTRDCLLSIQYFQSNNVCICSLHVASEFIIIIIAIVCEQWTCFACAYVTYIIILYVRVQYYNYKNHNNKN